MFCSNCGEALADQAKFCTRCGSRVDIFNANCQNQNMRMQNEGIWVINELYKKEKIGLYI